MVQEALAALSPLDAREALLALRLLPEVELDLAACRDSAAQQGATLAACRGAQVPCPVVEAESWGEMWLGRAGWLLSGVAIGLAAGLVVAVSAR